MKTKNWIIISAAMIVAGVVMLVVNQIVFVPKFMAFSNAMLAWAENGTLASPPAMEAFGLNEASFYANTILSNTGIVLIFIGAAYIVTFFASKILKKTA